MNISLENLRGVARGGRRALAVPVALGLAMALVACNEDDDAATSGAAEKAEQVDEFAGLTEVDAETYDMEPFMDGYAFNFRTGGDAVGVCLASDGTVSCLGEPDDSAPDAVKSLPGRPNGIELTGDATEFVNYDFTGGVPPEEELVAGQKVSFGSVTCGMVDDSTLKCREDEAWFSITGADRDIVVAKGGDTATAAATSQAASGSRVDDVDPEDFEFQGGAYAFLLEDGETACVISGPSTPLSGVGCYVELDDPPLSPGNNTPVSLFEMTPNGDAGLTTDMHPLDRGGIETLDPGQRIEAHGITCTALGGSDFSCEANGTEVVFQDGETPDIPVVQGGAGAIAKAAQSGSGGSSARKSVGQSCGEVTVERDGSAKTVEVREGRVDCGEVLPIVEEYVNTPADPYYGQRNMRTYGEWTCAIQSAMQAQETGYDISCGTTDGRAVGVPAK